MPGYIQKKKSDNRVMSVLSVSPHNSGKHFIKNPNNLIKNTYLMTTNSNNLINNQVAIIFDQHKKISYKTVNKRKISKKSSNHGNFLSADM